MNLKQIQNLPNTLLGKPLNLIRYFNGYSPLLLDICLCITYKCNLNCDFCYQKRDKGTLFSDMTIEEATLIEQNIRKSFPLGRRIHIFGGEPTINIYFSEILKLFSYYNYKISFTCNDTNIVNFTDTISKLKNLCAINISLNHLHFKKTYDILELFKGISNRKSIFITLACPINATNQNKIIDIVKEFETLNLNCLCFQHTTLTEHYNKIINSQLILEQIKKLRLLRPKIPVIFLPNIRISDIKNYYDNKSFPLKKNKCLAPWFTSFVQPNGDVIPCDEVNIIMGNLKNDNLNNIWNNKKYRDFRKNIQRYGISHQICKRCCHRQYY
jgi:radical SAM protein with 4Fe4S-binding SPASM domain